MAQFIFHILTGGPQHDIRSFPATRSAAIVAWPVSARRGVHSLR